MRIIPDMPNLRVRPPGQAASTVVDDRKSRPPATDLTQ